MKRTIKFGIWLTGHDEKTIEQMYEDFAKSKTEAKKLPISDMESIKDKILKEYKKGNIVVAGIDGLQGMPIKEFIKQPVEGMLYDLNRDPATILTLINDPKWVNDYAVMTVIIELKKRIKELEEQLTKE